MQRETEAKILGLLDVISVPVAGNDRKISEWQSDMRRSFGRVDRRLGYLEHRVESSETEVGAVTTGLRDFRDQFVRRIAPLER